MNSSTKKLSAMISALTFATISTTVSAGDMKGHHKNFDAVDTNNDGMLQQSEVDALDMTDTYYNDDVFARYDSDKNDSLNRQEYLLLIDGVRVDQRVTANDTYNNASVSKRMADNPESNTETGPRGDVVTVKQKSPVVTVTKPAPEITVKQPEPKVKVITSEPEVSVQQSEPRVSVQQSQPTVEIDQARPDISIEQSDPEVNVRQQQPEVSVQQAEPTVNMETNTRVERISVDVYEAPLDELDNAIVRNGSNVHFGRVHDVVYKDDRSEAGVLIKGEDSRGLLYIPADHIEMQGDELVITSFAKVQRDNEYDANRLRSATDGKYKNLGEAMNNKPLSSR